MNGRALARARARGRPFAGCATISNIAARFMATLAFAAAASAQESSGRRTTDAAWTVDTASVTFAIRNAGLPVRGTFGGLEATVCFDPDAPAAGSIVASIDPATIDTGIGLRDRHLVRRGYFEVEKYGRIEMRSISLNGAATGTAYTGTFLLRMRDVEREVEVPFTFEDSGAKARIAGSLELNRLDWGIGRAGLILSDNVTVMVDLTLSPAPAACL